MKKLLIISPYFPPVNAADMHRVRTSLAYFHENGWQAEVVCIDPAYTNIGLDELLLKSVPPNIKIHRVKAISIKYTQKVGLGSLALRSLWYYRKYVNGLLKTQHFDLVYFSTTQFPVCILGAYWKKKFNIPYVIDMQDPWHSHYYRDKPKAQQPPKYWFSYRLNKHLEPIAIKKASGLISVSEDYITTLKTRYPVISKIPAATITFGMYPPDIKIAAENQANFERILKPGFINIVYIGRGGADMHRAIEPLFNAIKNGLNADAAIFGRLRLYFIGTSYAPDGEGHPTIMPLAKRFGISDYVTEITNRISYYHTLATLMEADALFVPGSDDAKYTASKIYPYILTKKPLLGIFNANSSAIGILKEFGIGTVYDYESVSNYAIIEFMKGLAGNPDALSDLPPGALKKHSAQTKTTQQCQLFTEALLYEQP
nr:hypothetical protein [uncultured Mucilaginibacter sp.]